MVHFFPFGSPGPLVGSPRTLGAVAGGIPKPCTAPLWAGLAWLVGFGWLFLGFKVDFGWISAEFRLGTSVGFWLLASIH